MVSAVARPAETTCLRSGSDHTAQRVADRVAEEDERRLREVLDFPNGPWRVSGKTGAGTTIGRARPCPWPVPWITARSAAQP